MCYLSVRIAARYDRIANFSPATKKPKHPRKGTIYVHDKPLVHGANIKWVFGHPCWDHPAFAVKPRLEVMPDNPSCFVLPSNAAL